MVDSQGRYPALTIAPDPALASISKSLNLLGASAQATTFVQRPVEHELCGSVAYGLALMCSGLEPEDSALQKFLERAASHVVQMTEHEDEVPPDLYANLCCSKLWLADVPVVNSGCCSTRLRVGVGVGVDGVCVCVRCARCVLGLRVCVSYAMFCVGVCCGVGLAIEFASLGP